MLTPYQKQLIEKASFFFTGHGDFLTDKEEIDYSNFYRENIEFKSEIDRDKNIQSWIKSQTKMVQDSDRSMKDYLVEHHIPRDESIPLHIQFLDAYKKPR